jgi:hypothetical protein
MTQQAPVLRYDKTLADEQLAAREMIVEMDHPSSPTKRIGQ